MQLDTRIPLMVQGPQIESPQNMLAQALKVRQLQGQVQEQDRAISQRNALAGVLGTAFDDHGRLNSGALGKIAQAAPDYAPQYANLAATQQRLDRQDQLTTTALAQKRFDWLRNAAAASLSPQDAYAQIENGVQMGVVTPQEAQTWKSQIPTEQGAFDSWIKGINSQMMTAGQRAELAKGSYSAPAQSSQGFFQADRAGNVRVLNGPDGKPLMPVTLDAAGQASVAGAKTTATKEAENAVAKPGKAIEAKTSLDSTVSALDRLAERAKSIRENEALGRITGMSSMFPNWPGGGAADVKGDLDNLRSQVGFAVLQAMRDASKTGGALGAISDKENELLQNNLAPLMKEQSKEKLQESLKDIEAYVDAAKKRLQGAYQQQYGNTVEQPAAPGGNGGVLSPPGRTVVRTGTLPDGRRIVQYSDGSTGLAE